MKPKMLYRWTGVAIAVTIVGTQIPQLAFATDAIWNPQVAIVWPHDSQGRPSDTGHSQQVNVSIWPTNQVSCSPPQAALSPWSGELLVAKDNDVTESVGAATRLSTRPADIGYFPVLEYDDISADLTGNPGTQYHFVVFGSSPTMFYGGPISNVWNHAIDARTNIPHPLMPTGVDPNPVEPDARIQIVWPHDTNGNFAPVDQAPLVNIAVDIFEHGTLNSLAPERANWYSVILLAAVNNQPPTQVTANEDVTTYAANGLTLPRYVFNDVPVRPGVPSTFLADALVAGSKGFNNRFSIWVHASDPRTILPVPSPPPHCSG